MVSNPPFVITPRSVGEASADQFTYRDGGLPGDDIVAALVRDLPAVLAPGGTAQLLGNWEIPAGAEWAERPQSWASPDADVWFIQREQVGPEQYAETWLQDASEARDRRLYQESYAAYLDDFASRNVEAIGFGMIWLRRPAAGSPVLRRFEEITYPIEQPVGPRPGRSRRARRLAGCPRPAGRAPAGGRGCYRGTAPAPGRRTPRRHPAAPRRRAAPHQPAEHRAGRLCLSVRRRALRRADHRCP